MPQGLSDGAFGALGRWGYVVILLPTFPAIPYEFLSMAGHNTAFSAVLQPRPLLSLWFLLLSELSGDISCVGWFQLLAHRLRHSTCTRHANSQSEVAYITGQRCVFWVCEDDLRLAIRPASHPAGVETDGLFLVKAAQIAPRSLAELVQAIVSSPSRNMVGTDLTLRPI